MTGLVIALIALGIIVVIHELGHLLAAKFFKIKVCTFSVGFGPRVASVRYGETDYCLSAFPVGGYVKMASDDSSNDAAHQPVDFTSKPRHQRFLVALAGPAMNMVLAVVLLSALNMYGVPTSRPTTIVEQVVDGSPAQAAGIRAGDRVLRLQGIDVAGSGRSVQEIVQNVPDETIQVVVLRNGSELEINVKRVVQQGRPQLGIYFQISPVVVKHGFTGAVNESVATNSQFVLMIFDTLGSLFKGEASLQHLEGPLGLVRVTGQAADHSLAALIGLMALISVNLGIMNLLPIPILDGGTMLLLLIEALMGRDLSLIVKERVLQAGLVVLLILFVVVLYNDILKWIGPATIG